MLIPLHEHLDPRRTLTTIPREGGGARKISLAGRMGLNTTSIRTRFPVAPHNLNEARGALTLWVLALEDLATVGPSETIEKYDPHYQNYTLLSDGAEVRAWRDATFAFVFWTSWYPVLFVKMFRGDWWRNAFEPMSGDWPAGHVPRFRPLAGAGHFRLHKHRWYQFGFAWDKPCSDYRLYANGLLIATANTFAQRIEPELVGETLYAGHPCLALSDAKFYAHPLTGQQFEESFHREAATVDEGLQRELRDAFVGDKAEPFVWRPEPGWTLQLDAPLTRPDDLKLFSVQGKQDAAQITPDGMRVTTHPVRRPTPRDWDGGPHRETFDEDQVYLWTKQTFEGEIAVEFEFMPLQHNGLALLMAQASGMGREDFLADYPPRVSGGMRVVCWENIRNYHWEFFREMDDCRNDVASHALIKNPWFRPLAYSCRPERIALNRWHTIQFVQDGSRLRGALDGTVAVKASDEAFSNHGPVYSAGHVALRCMFRTQMIFRNLRIYTKSLPYAVVETV